MAKLMTALLVVVTVVLTRFAPTADELKAYFEQAQKFYASGAYEQALDKYRKIIEVESRFIDKSKVLVSVGGMDVPVDEAALYQSGNCYFKLFVEAKDRAEGTFDPEERRRYEAEARKYLDLSISSFSEVESKASDTKLRALAQKRLVDLLYHDGRYKEVVEQAERLMARYPTSEYVVDALYNIGWSYFKMGDYQRSIQTFEELVRRFPEDYRTDRALFQVGECYYRQGKYDLASGYYRRIVEKYRIEELTEQEIQRMEREKLAGLVDETALELAGKAQLRVGDCYAQLGELRKAAEVYGKAARVFGRYRWVVEQAYIRLADAYLERGEVEAAADVYRDAIDRVEDKFFKAKMQALVAKLYYDAGKFEEAIREYDLYMRAYGEVADRTQLSLAEAEYKVGRAFFEMGKELDSSEKYEEAISHYTRILERWPESRMVVAAKFNIALCKQMMGRLREALEGFSSIVDEHPKDEYVPNCLLQMARIHCELGEYEESMKLYRKLSSSFPDFMRDAVRFELGLVLKKMGRTEEAVEMCLKVGPESELYPKAVLEAGQMLISLGKFERAVDVVKGAIGRLGGEWRVKAYYVLGKALMGMKEYEGAIEAFTEVVGGTEEGRLRQSAIYGRGVAYFSLGKYRQAQEDFSLLLESEDVKIRYSSRKLLGMALIRQGKERDAIGHIEELISLTSDPYAKAEYMLLLSELLYGAGDYEKMIEICEEIIHMGLGDRKTELPYYLNEKAYFLLGEGYSKLGDYDMAARTYAEGLKKYPDGYYSGDMLFGLAFSHFQCGRMYDAAICFERFLSEHPDDANSPYAKYYLGYAFFNQSVFDRAAETFADLGLKFPKLEISPDALFRAGESYFNLGKFELALDFYRKVVEGYPRSPQADDALYSMAWAFLEEGKDDKAVECFERLLREFPESEFCPYARFSLGDYYYNLGEYRRAFEEYSRVLKDYPDEEVASKVPEILDDLREVVAYQDYEKARDVFREALASKDLEKFEEAARLFQEIVRKHPGTESAVGALSNMGICYEYLKNWKRAVSVYDRVIAMYEQGKASPEAYRFAKAHRDWIVANRL